MSWIIGLLTFFLVVDCLLLILLVLIQLPKKEAGMGQAFGGGATDALFGAGSGTALTKMTKYVTVFFFVLTLMLTVTSGHQNRRRVEDPRKHLTQGDKAPEINPAPNAAAASTNTPKLTNSLLLSATNAATPAPGTNAAVPPVEKK